MIEINNPRAFARPASRGNNYLTGEEDVVVDPQPGMTLLDYLAAHALQGLLAERPWPSDPQVAERAYQVAEAMLVERSRRRL